MEPPASASEGRGLPSFLSGGHTLILATGVMLPVSGAIIRWIRFASIGVGAPEHLAVSLPVGELAAQGAWPIGTALGFLGLVVWLTRPMRFRQAWISVSAALIAALPAVVLFGWTALFPIAVSAAAFHFGLHIRVGREWRSAWGMGVLLSVYALTAASAGLAPSAGRAEDYSFRDGVTEDGVYLAGGATDSTILILSCRSPGEVVEVRSEDVLLVRRSRAPVASDPLTRLFSRPSYFDACPKG
jgi:hypothetical protein